MSGQVKASGVRYHHLFSSASLHHHEQPPRVWASNRCGGREREGEGEEEAERVGHKAQSEEEMGVEWCG